MIRQFLTIKKSLVSFLSKRPENASRGCSPSLTTPFLYKSPFHPRRVSLTMSEITHRTPKMENASCYSNLALSQWRSIWSMVSNSVLHKAHPLAKVHPLSWSWSKVKTFPQQASQVKKLAFEGIQGFPTIFKGKGVVLPVSNTE